MAKTGTHHLAKSAYWRIGLLCGLASGCSLGQYAVPQTATMAAEQTPPVQPALCDASESDATAEPAPAPATVQPAPPVAPLPAPPATLPQPTAPVNIQIGTLPPDGLKGILAKLGKKKDPQTTPSLDPATAASPAAVPAPAVVPAPAASLKLTALPTTCRSAAAKPAAVAAANTLPTAVGPFHDTSAAALAAQLNHEYSTKTGYKTWKSNSVHPLAGLDFSGATFMDPVLYESLQNKDPMPPLGASSVLELYSDAAGTKLRGWAILAKATATADAGAWLSIEIDISALDGSTSATTHAMGAASCASCHASQPSYMVPVVFD